MVSATPPPDPAAPASCEPAPARDARESIGGVLGVGLGLLLVVVGLLAPWRGAAVRPIEDGEALLREAFEIDALPFGARVERAERARDGRVSVHLKPADAPPDLLLPTPRGGSGGRGRPGGGGGSGGWGKGPDWAGLEPGEPTIPVELLLERHPPAKAEAMIRRRFRDLRYKDFEDVRGSGETVPVDAGELPWGPYAVRWVHLRVFEKDGERATFHDVVRVNLTLGRVCWFLHVRWGDRTPGRLEDVRAALDALLPVSGVLEPAAG